MLIALLAMVAILMVVAVRLMKKTAFSRQRLNRIGLYSAIAVVLVIALFPFWWIINTSLKQPVDIFGNLTLYPHSPTLTNYKQLFYIPLWRVPPNSLIIVIISVSISMVRHSRPIRWPDRGFVSVSISRRWWPR